MPTARRALIAGLGLTLLLAVIIPRFNELIVLFGHHAITSLNNPEPDEVATCEPFLFRQIDGCSLSHLEFH